MTEGERETALHECVTHLSTGSKPLADAQLAKALWAVVDWLGGCTQDAVDEVDGQEAVAALSHTQFELEEMVIAAGIERP